MTTCTESGTQKMGISLKWVFTSAISTAKLTTPDLKFSPIWKRISTVYPGRFMLSCCCHLLLNFILCLSSQIRNPLALFRLICHTVVGLMFFPGLLTVWLLTHYIHLCEQFLVSLAPGFSSTPISPLLLINSVSAPVISKSRMETDGSSQKTLSTGNYTLTCLIVCHI